MARGESLRVEWRSDAARDRTGDGPEAVSRFYRLLVAARSRHMNAKITTRTG